MSASSSRTFQPPYANSPSSTSASSVNYSSYGSQSFMGPGGRVASSSSSSAFGAASRPIPGSRQASGSGSMMREQIGGERDRGKDADGRKVDAREVARVHWAALKEYLDPWLDQEQPDARSSAREKLTRLTRQQFQELSTDVYDELMRRINAEESPDEALPHLPVRADFHPKRNQARQKLATLPKSRFRDLSSDVFHELKRRFPDFEESSPRRMTDRDEYGEPPPAPGPMGVRPGYERAPSSASLRDQGRPRLEQRAPSAASRHLRQDSRNVSGDSLSGQARIGMGMHRSTSSRDMGGNLASATSEMVIPNKSRMREEDIEVPYARDSVVSPVRSVSQRSLNVLDRRDSVQSSSASHGPGPSSALDARARTPAGRPVDPMEVMSPATQDDREYYDRMSFSSNVTNKSRAQGLGAGTEKGWDEDREQKIRAEYEFRIAGLERRAQLAEGQIEEMRRGEAGSRDRERGWEDELRGHKERATNHASALRSLQHELDVARDAAEAARTHSDARIREAQEDGRAWEDRYHRLEEEVRRLETEKGALEAAQVSGGGEQAVRELKKEIHSLVDELNALSARNDQLVAEREADAQSMMEMEARVEEYRRKFDAVRMELRNLKATSTMFASKPITDDHLPASPDGNIKDINVSAFQSAIDGLLTAARSSTPSGVLSAMKAIVEAVTEIGEDVKTFETRPNIDVDVSKLESLKHESTARLNNLMQAARNHAMASGLSPVSLIDGAAGHLSSNVVEIIKLLKIKRTSGSTASAAGAASAMSRSRSRSSLSIKDMVNRSTSGTPDLRRVNGDWNREYGRQGSEERLQPPVVIRRPSGEDSPPARNLSRQATPLQTSPPTSGGLNGSSSLGVSASSVPAPASSGPGPGNQAGLGYGHPQGANLRVNSYQSSSQRSDAFDLERKGSGASERQMPRAQLEQGGAGGAGTNGWGRSDGDRVSYDSTVDAGHGAGYGGPAKARSPAPDPETEFVHPAGTEQEWEDLKPYLNTQSSLLVNSIQNLLAAIRSGTHTPALNEHLSEVIAIASSIVAVSTNGLPASLRREGDALLRELVACTNRLSEAQDMSGGQGGQFDKNARQVVASAAFGVAKSLKALMKLGTVE